MDSLFDRREKVPRSQALRPQNHLVGSSRIRNTWACPGYGTQPQGSKHQYLEDLGCLHAYTYIYIYRTILKSIICGVYKGYIMVHSKDHIVYLLQDDCAYRDLFLWFGPSTHCFSTWTLWATGCCRNFRALLEADTISMFCCRCRVPFLQPILVS